MIQSDFPTRQPAPKIGENGTWLEWDELTGDYVDTGRPSRGDSAGLSGDIKAALLTLAQKVAYVDEHGQDYYDALYAALYPPAELLTITASFAQGSHTVYDTDTLDSLKPYLTVTGIYDDGSSRTITNYTLSGTLVEGTSTITVTASGKTATFTVSVTHKVAQVTGISAVFTQGSAVIYDNASLDDLKPYLVVTASYDDSTSAAVDGYTLSGTLTVGTSTITVTYSGFTDTFSVTVTAHPVVLTSITAVFAQGDNVVYTTDSLDTLKQYLVVTAHYDDSTASTVASTDYTLSGALATGTSTVTVSYGGFTDTFSVTVTDDSGILYRWDFTQSLIDSKNGLEAIVSGLTRDANGLSYTGQKQSVDLGAIYALNRTYEIDVSDFDMKASTDYNIRFVMVGTSAGNASDTLLTWRHNNTIGWSSYLGAWSTAIYGSLSERNSFANKTVRITISEAGEISLYLDGVFAGKSSLTATTHSDWHIYLGSGGAANVGGDLHNCKITGVRVYEGLVI